MIRRIAALALLCSAVSACDSATDVTPAARYGLDTDPPVVLANDVARIELLRDEFQLDGDGKARRELTQRVDYVSPGIRDTTVTYNEQYFYRVDGRTIEMEALCPPDALCAPPPHVWGRVTGEGLELRSLVAPDVLLTYRRVFP